VRASGIPAGKSHLTAGVTFFVALPRTAQRRVFRPARRVSWGTIIFSILVFLLAIGAVAGFLVIVLPGRVATLSQNEANELRTARQGAAGVSLSTTTLWSDLSANGSMGLSDSRLFQDLALAQSIEKAGDDALAHAQAADQYLAEADAIPFQLHAPAFVSTDRPALVHLEKALAAAIKLAHGATLQITLAQHVSQDMHTVTGQLNSSLLTHDWTAASRTAAAIQQDLKAQENAASNAETLLDPLWIAWMDATVGYAATAQQFSLTSAANQTQSAQQLARALNAANDQIGQKMAQAQAHAAAWNQKTVQPLLVTLAKELAAAS
jgi:lipopolysaccharide export LptBFGC system permease protein LptF